jgi:hypothetical protein
MILLRFLSFALGAVIVAGTLFSAVETLVLPRSAPDALTRLVFVSVRRVFNLRLRWARSYQERDQILAFYAPIGLLVLLSTWLGLVFIGYTGILWGVGAGSWYAAFRISGSSLLTLGFAAVDGLPMTVLAFSEATFGLILVAMLIAYLPTMYAAFSRRETPVTMLEVRASNPPSAVEMILRFHRIHGLDRLSEQWRSWEVWFADIEESHTSLPALVFFRSPRPDRSWVTAGGAVLDAASLTLSAVDVPYDAGGALCIRGGFLALRSIADFFSIPYNPDPHPGDPISITRQEFDAACDRLAEAGVPLKPDREQAWRDFAGWRVNYDSVLLDLAGLIVVPTAPWSGDRATSFRTPPLVRPILKVGRRRPGLTSTGQDLPSEGLSPRTDAE